MIYINPADFASQKDLTTSWNINKELEINVRLIKYTPKTVQQNKNARSFR